VNFFPAISICFLLLAIAYLEIGLAGRGTGCCGGSARLVHLVFLLAILYRWIHVPSRCCTA
jgi:hypothetical protein